ncbi:putative E3 ubiquitin-protein ligase ARI14 [Cardamine amara subsp. amara]|uniref:RBR-type E3 ubiquitin transferase n=1 Tax=Cardamine amara subsp. amara TaxID=228776 RepID=A0ABD1AB88_CARAN
MAHDRERPYSVLKMGDVKEKMKKQIIEISEIFMLSKSDAIVLLMYLRWDSLRVSERLAENKDKLLTESGLKSLVIDSNDALSDSSSETCFDEFYEFADDHDDESVGDEDLISTPICSHKFSADYWREYLDKNYYSAKKIQTTISCPVLDCRASVGSDTIEKLPRYDRNLYDRYVRRSYFEGNKALMIKKCTAPGCGYIIVFHQANNDTDGDEEFSLSVVCLCGHTFCLRCGLESHRPVTCNNASDWLFRDLNKLPEESDDESLNITNTKTCLNCLSSLKLVNRSERKYMTCACSFRFCNWCFRPEEAHKKESKSFGKCVVVTVGNSCVDRWKMCETSLEQAKADLKLFEESNVKKPSILNEQDIKILREGLMLIVQCRRVLKWICVFDYFHTEYEMSKREYLRYLQGNAGVALQRYSNNLQEQKDRLFTAASTPEEPLCSNSKISIVTSDIGNYFYDFIKTLQDGLADLKVKSYDDCGGPYWLCDRCTSGNNWLHKKCEMCRDETAIPVEMLSDLSIN